MLTTIVLLVAACRSNVIHRADLSRWKAQRFAEHGISIDMPRDASTQFGIAMHYRSNGIADATWFIKIAIERKSKESFSEPLPISPENRLASDAEYMAWLRWITEYHPTVSVHESSSDYRHYRRDVDLGDGTVASIHAEYFSLPFSAAESAQDDAAIRRILISARPIE